MAIALNPGFAILIGAALALILPRDLRWMSMLASALAALFLVFTPSFGEQAGFAQIGLEITPLRLDSLSQVFGLAFCLVTIILALGASSRRHRLEDVALMAHAGGAATAVFAGDLVSFVAAAQFSALAGAGLVFAGGGERAAAAGVRVLIWQVLAGALLTAGLGLLLAQGADVRFERIGAQTPGGALMFAGLLVMAGAPLAHVWVKDAVRHASPLGAAALSAFTLKLAIYALARGFPGEPILAPLGAVLAVAPLIYAAATDDLRESLGYGLLSQTGAMMAAVGCGTPLALAGAAAFGFASALQGVLAFLAIGAVVARLGHARASALGGLARSMPVTTLLAMVAALSALAIPGFAGFSAYALLTDAVAQADRPLVWLALIAAGAGAVLHAGVRAPLAAFFGDDRGLRPAEPAFMTHLAMGFAAFFCVAVGLAPGWLYGLLPDEVRFAPFDWEHVLTHLQLTTFAALVFGAWSWARRFARREGGEVLDVDWLYRRPARAGARAMGAVLLGVYEAWNAAAAGLGQTAGRAAAWGLRRADRPSGETSMGAIWILVVLAGILAVLYAFQG